MNSAPTKDGRLAREIDWSTPTDALTDGAEGVNHSPQLIGDDKPWAEEGRNKSERARRKAAHSMFRLGRPRRTQPHRRRLWWNPLPQMELDPSLTLLCHICKAYGAA